MAKLKLAVNPTFKSKVGIPIPGEDKPAEVEMTFKHRTKSELSAWQKHLLEDQVSDPDLFMESVLGWELEDEFNRANVERFLDVYGGAATATYVHYLEQLTRARVGN